MDRDVKFHIEAPGAQTTATLRVVVGGHCEVAIRRCDEGETSPGRADQRTAANDPPRCPAPDAHLRRGIPAASDQVHPRRTAEAAKRAGLAYGRAGDGVTFHTLRHTAASLLAELGESEAIRKEVMHRDIATTQRYTHLRPIHEIPAHERLATAMPIADLVMDPRRRARNKAVGKSVGTLPDTDRQTPTKTGSLRQTPTGDQNPATYYK